MKENLIENDIINAWQENGVLFTQFKVDVMDGDCAKIAVQTREKVGEGKSFPILVDAGRVKTITKEARDYFASEEGSKNLLASA